MKDACPDSGCRCDPVIPPLTPPHCMTSIGFRQAISPQLHTGFGLRKWLTCAPRAKVYAVCVSTMVFSARLMLFNAPMASGCQCCFCPAQTELWETVFWMFMSLQSIYTHGTHELETTEIWIKASFGKSMLCLLAIQFMHTAVSSRVFVGVCSHLSNEACCNYSVVKILPWEFECCHPKNQNKKELSSLLKD